MYQDPQNNEEIILLQTIEKDLSADQSLQQICKIIGQQNQNPRLLIFLQELFKMLFNLYIQKDCLQKAFKVLNNILNKYKFRNRPIQTSDLSHYINQKYYEVLAHFYEKAFLKGADEAYKHMNFIYYKKIARDYMQSPNCSNSAMTKNILTKIDQIYQTFTGNTIQEFEMAVYECLNTQEQELFTQIVTDDQNNTPKQTNSLQEKFLFNLPPDLQEKYRSQNFTDIYTFKDYLVQEKQIKGIEKILGYIFVDKLNFYLNSYYFVNSAKKIKENKSDLQKQLQELEKDIMDSQKDYYSFIDIPSVKYFYKSLKSKRVRNLKGQCFSFKKKLIEFIKLEINSCEIPKKFNIAQFEKWNEIYFSLYSELQRSTTMEEANFAFNIIQNVQQLILSFLRFRWNYLYLFCALIVEAKLDQLDTILDIAYDMMQNTNKANLNRTFDQILVQLNVKANTQITSDYFDKNGYNLGYISLQVLESLFPYINNKLIKVMLQVNLQSNLKIKLINDLKTFEFQLIHDCSQNLKNYSKIFDKLIDSILEGEKEEKEQKAIFLKAYTIQFQQRLKSLINERPNKQLGQQFFNTYFLNVSKLKQDYQRKALGQYQEIFQREEKISQICEQYILKEPEKFNQLYQGDIQKELLPIFIDNFLKDNPFVIFLPALFKGLGFFRPQKQIFFEKLERVRFAAIAFKDKDQNEINKFIEFMIVQKDLYTFEQQFQIAKNIYNFYITLPNFVGESSVCKPITESFPIFSQMKSISDYNSTTYNAICVFTSKFISLDQKAVIKSEDQLKNSDLLKKLSNLMNEKTQLEFNQQDILSIQFQELKNYKAQLIKEVQQNNNQNFQNKCIEVFQRQANRQLIISEIIEYKKQFKIPQNEIEQFYWSKNFWIQVGNQEIRQNIDSIIKKKVEEYFKQLIGLSSLSQLNDKLQKDFNSVQDSYIPYIKELIKKQYPKYKEEFEKNFNRAVTYTPQIKLSILQMTEIQKKLSIIRQDQIYKEFQTEDQSILTFINEQFSLYMKQLLGKVFQVAITQKPGYEFKVFQNKSISPNDNLMTKYKQNQELQGKFGPQKNSYLDIALLTSSENKNQLYYELCDYTPTQRQIEFRNFLIEIEPLQEDKLKNKIRKNKWKEEHPELEEVLRKRIKRGAELWNQVQDFLCKRENNENTMDSDEESEKYKGEQQQIIDIVEDDQLDQKLQDVQRSFERQLITGRNYIKTRLNNMDNDNPLLTQKEITVKTVQFVLEQHPYFKKSKILYKSYIL